MKQVYIDAIAVVNAMLFQAKLEKDSDLVSCYQRLLSHAIENYEKRYGKL